jgi:hypothetical protein
MDNQELKIEEVNKLDELKKELGFVELEERLEMAQLTGLSLTDRCIVVKK